MKFYLENITTGDCDDDFEKNCSTREDYEMFLEENGFDFSLTGSPRRKNNDAAWENYAIMWGAE